MGTTPFVFTVSLSAASAATVTVDFATADNGSAVAGQDYAAASGSLSFAPGETSQQVTVLVNGDAVVEPDETFVVNLSNPANATIADGQAVGTIVNDDFGPPDQLPTDIALSSASVAENQPVGTAVGTLSATDPDMGDTFTFSLVAGAGSTDNGSFRVSGTQLQTAAVFDFEAKSAYSVRVRVDDGRGGSFEKQFAITVTDANDPPTDVAVSNTSVDENQPAGTIVGVLSASDPDGGQTIAWSLQPSGCGGSFPDSSAFQISGSLLQTAAVFDFETKSSYSICVRATDNGTPAASADTVFTIGVNNVNEAPTDITLSGTSVAENQPSGTTVGTLAAVDDPGDTDTFTLVPGTGSTDNGSFQISGNQLQTGAVFDFETKSSYSIRVRATDQLSHSFEKQFTITVTNVNEPPTNITLSSSSVPENQPAGTVVGTLSATDPDAGDTFTFSLVTGMGSTDNGSFQISGNQLQTAAVFDFETKISYSIRMRVTDSGNQSFEKQFTIRVTNVNEAPTAVGDSSTTDEDTAKSLDPRANDTDPDAGDLLSITAVGTPDNGGSVMITGGGTGVQFTPGAAFQDLNVGQSRVTHFTYTIRDAGGLTSTATVTITVTGVNDAPVGVADTFNGANSALAGVTLAVSTSPSGPNVAVAGNVLTNDSDVDTAHANLTATAGTTTSTNNGSVTMNTDGTFSYVPPPGFTGDDTFTYTVHDHGSPDLTGTGTVTIHVVGPRVWFVNPGGAAGNGTSAAPFASLAPLSSGGGSDSLDGSGDIIFVYQGTGNAASAGFVLEANQQLIGQPQGLTVTDALARTFNLVTAGGANPTVSSSGGAGLTLADGNTIQRINVSGSTGPGVTGTSIGTLTYGPNTTISGNTGGGLALSGAAGGAITVGAAISTTAGHSVSISSRTSGTTSLTGAVNDTGTGILLNANTGATINLTGGVTASTGANAAFTATGGGTITVAGAANTLTTTTGTALTVTNTTIGAGGLTFRSISSNGAANGILLNTTGSGGLTVTGDGSTANSGGTITESTGSANDADTAGKAVYLANAASVTLKFMRVSVTSANASGIVATNLGGTNLLDRSVIDFNNTPVVPVPTANDLGVSVTNTNVDTTITLDGTTVQNKLDGFSATNYSMRGTSTLTLNVQDSNTGDSFVSKYTGLFGSGGVVGCGDTAGSTGTCTVNVSNTKFVTPATNGINDWEMGVQQSNVLNFNVHDNTFDMSSNGANALVGMINVNATGNGRIGSPNDEAVIQNNTIQNLGSSGALLGYQAIRVAPDNCSLSGATPCTVSPVTHRLRIQGNTIQNVWQTAVNISARGKANLNLQFLDNVVGTVANPVGKSNRRGVLMETQANSNLFASISGNTIVNAGTSNSNSALALRAGTDNGEGDANGTVNATVSGNTIKNTASAGTGGWFRAETVALGSGVSAGNICLDYNTNTLKNSSDANNPSAEFNLMHNSTGTFTRRNGGGNVGTETTSGTIGSNTGCTLPSFQ